MVSHRCTNRSEYDQIVTLRAIGEAFTADDNQSFPKAMRAMPLILRWLGWPAHGDIVVSTGNEENITDENTGARIGYRIEMKVKVAQRPADTLRYKILDHLFTDMMAAKVAGERNVEAVLLDAIQKVSAIGPSHTPPAVSDVIIRVSVRRIDGKEYAFACDGQNPIAIQHGNYEAICDAVFQALKANA